LHNVPYYLEYNFWVR